MLISERHAQILLELQKKPAITVAQMAKKLNFSEPTIRRDYTELHIPVFSTGGEMRTNSFSYIGKEAEDAVRRYNADIAFFSCHGLSLEGMMSDPSVEECHLRQVMLEKARKKYLLCDSSKLDRTYFYDMGNISSLDGVISDRPLPEALSRLLKK